jgi:hypothetical protein
MKKNVVLLAAGALVFGATLFSGIAISKNSVSLVELKSSARVNCVNAQDKCYDDFQGITYFQMHDSNSE